MKFEVGQTLWFVPKREDRKESFEVEISKVGRQWLHTTKVGYRGERVTGPKLSRDHLGTAYMEYPPGQAYLSQEHRAEAAKVSQMWRQIFTRFAHSLPPHITVADVRLIDAILAGKNK